MADREEIVRAAYNRAWEDFERIAQTLPERRLAPQRLRQHVQALFESGERDPEKIGVAALGRLRDAEQVERSRTRVIRSNDIPDAG